jgi:hypothetical protein
VEEDDMKKVILLLRFIRSSPLLNLIALKHYSNSVRCVTCL